MGKPEEKLCPICGLRNVDNVKSHIYSKFLTKQMRMVGDKRTIYNFTDEILKVIFVDKFDEDLPKLRFDQDFPTERYLLCKECEGDTGRKIEGEYASHIHEKLLKTLEDPTSKSLSIKPSEVELFYKVWLLNLYRLGLYKDREIEIFEDTQVDAAIVWDSIVDKEHIPHIKMEAYFGTCEDWTDNSLFIAKFSSCVYYMMIGNYIVLIYISGHPDESNVISKENPQIKRLHNSTWTKIVHSFSGEREMDYVKELTGIGGYANFHHLFRTILKSDPNLNPQ